MASLWLVLLLAVLGTVSTEEVEARKPKLFYVSTTTTTTTWKGSTVCFVSTATGVDKISACKRKKRSMSEESSLDIDAAMITPTDSG
jgi:hypothetical protein